MLIAVSRWQFVYICVADIHSNTLLLLTSNTSVDKYMYNTCNLRVVDSYALGYQFVLVGPE